MKKEDLMLEIIKLKEHIGCLKNDFDEQKGIYTKVSEHINEVDYLLSNNLDIYLDDTYESIFKYIFKDVIESSKFSNMFNSQLIKVKEYIENSSSDEIKNNYSEELEDIEEHFENLKESITSIVDFNFSYECIIQLLDTILEKNI